MSVETLLKSSIELKRAIANKFICFQFWYSFRKKFHFKSIYRFRALWNIWTCTVTVSVPYRTPNSIRSNPWSCSTWPTTKSPSSTTRPFAAYPACPPSTSPSTPWRGWRLIHLPVFETIWRSWRLPTPHWPYCQASSCPCWRCSMFLPITWPSCLPTP